MSENYLLELERSLEWTFIEDRATLDGASKPQLRQAMERSSLCT